MRLTGNELAIASSAVAAIAVIVGHLNVRTTNQSQLRLAHDEYKRDRLTDTYLQLLERVHLRASMIHSSLNRSNEDQAPLPKAIDPTTEKATTFRSRMAAYASPAVEEMWLDFAKETRDFNSYLLSLWNIYEMPPIEIEITALANKVMVDHKKWKESHGKLIACVRVELDPNFVGKRPPKPRSTA